MTSKMKSKTKLEMTLTKQITKNLNQQQNSERLKVNLLPRSMGVLSQYRTRALGLRNRRFSKKVQKGHKALTEKVFKRKPLKVEGKGNLSSILHTVSHPSLLSEKLVRLRKH